MLTCWGSWVGVWWLHVSSLMYIWHRKRNSFPQHLKELFHVVVPLEKYLVLFCCISGRFNCWKWGKIPDTARYSVEYPKHLTLLMETQQSRSCWWHRAADRGLPLHLLSISQKAARLGLKQTPSAFYRPKHRAYPDTVKWKWVKMKL